ncbi:MAG: electron transfer flavoprotein subunit alpha/FixB family protein [Deltaproteobacteria bacterium]|nr:electron transfer flavoprotein subunit alpha/FixB family protein [Deltaproteobacteria bacterium]
MATVLVIAEQAGGKVKKASLAAITAGQQLAKGGAMHIGVLGENPADAAASLLGYGAAKVHAAAHAGLAHYLAEPFAKVVADLAKANGATHVVLPATAQGKDVAPRIAARLGAGMASDISAVVDDKTFKRPMWAGNVVGAVEITTAVKVVTVRVSEFAAAAAGAAAGEVAKFAADPGTPKAKFIKFEEVKSARPELTEASIIVSGGRGTKSKEGYKATVEPLADLLGAAVGATRAIVDDGWVPNDWQVGQTGKVVAPQLYFALGISGAIQHVAGMKGSKTIVAINKDPDAPIFQVADYGLVADLAKAVPELMEEIKKVKG